MRRFDVKLPDRVRDFLDREAERTHRTMADLLRQYITDRPEYAVFAASQDLIGSPAEPVVEPAVEEDDDIDDDIDDSEWVEQERKRRENGDDK